MKISYNWLQSYFTKKLPKPEKLAELLTMRSFEVEQLSAVSRQPSEKKKKTESRELKANDWILDIDVLPNRAHDCLSHNGVAKECGALLKLNLKSKISKIQIKSQKLDKTINLSEKGAVNLNIKVNEPELCRRYAGRIVAGVKVCPSPKWLRERLEAIGQKSINNIVDATNYVMFETGQPLHAFDADKVGGGIVVRKACPARRGAKARERITTLDNQEVELDKDVLVIADEKDVLAIAGVKGGKKAEVDEKTTNIILEAANFEPVNIRKTSRRIGIRTESSLRFENEITPELAGEAMERLTGLILEIAGGEAGPETDIYPKRANRYKVGVRPRDVSKLLGVDVPEEEIRGILERLGFEIKKINPVKNVLKLAKSLAGKPYKYGASVSFDAPDAFDCSSFTAYVFARSGIRIPRRSVDQYFFGEAVDEKDAMPGDLVFACSEGGKVYRASVEFMRGLKIKEGIDHVGIYLGSGKVIHASRRNKNGVAIEDLKKSSGFKGKKFRGFRRVAGEKDDLLRVIVPCERLDVKRKEDLIEEVGRIYGYEKIPAALPEEVLLPPKRNLNFFYADVLRNILIGIGFSEAYNYSFGEKGDIELENPIAKDKKFLRTNLMDGLKKNIEDNLRYFKEARIFEIGRVFSREGEAILFAGMSSVSGPDGFYEIKGALEAVLGKLGITDAWFDDMEKGIAEVMAGNTSIGHIEKRGPYFGWELNLEMLVRIATEQVEYRPISKYPAVKRDLSVFVPPGTKVAAVLDIVENTAGTLLVDTDLFDIYEMPARSASQSRTGEKEEGRKSFAFHLVFQSPEKTLSEDEINALMGKIMDALDANPSWEVRRG